MTLATASQGHTESKSGYATKIRVGPCGVGCVPRHPRTSTGEIDESSIQVSGLPQIVPIQLADP
eukprot:6332475-Pyramimonas_sp.AAC.1